MSAIITGRVFWTDFPELSYNEKKGKKVTIKETTAKIVMLAIADSSDDFGENSWQSFQTIADKTSLERRSVIRVVRALMGNDILKVAGITKYGTNNFSVNTNMLGYPPKARAKAGRPKGGDSVAFTGDPVTETSDSDAETSDLKSPDPSSNPPDPSGKQRAAKPPTPPEIKLYREVARKNPPSPNYGNVVDAVKRISYRLGRDVLAADLLPFYQEWTARGYNQFSIKWLLDWAVSGIIPGKQSPTQNVPKGISVAQSWMARKQQEAGNG